MNSGERMEPTIRLELMTCRLRIDPVLRMLLCNNDCSRAFRGVLEHSGDRLYSSLTSRFQIGRFGNFDGGTSCYRCGLAFRFSEDEKYASAFQTGLSLLRAAFIDRVFA